MPLTLTQGILLCLRRIISPIIRTITRIMSRRIVLTSAKRTYLFEVLVTQFLDKSLKIPLDFR